MQTHIIRRRTSLVIFVSLVIVVLASCGARSTSRGSSPTIAPDSGPIIASPTSRPTPRPTSAVSSCDVVGYSSEMSLLLQEWTDANRLAMSTARISLPTVISNMQEIKRRAARIRPTQCMQDAHSALTKAMDYTIEAYLAYLADADEATIQEKLNLANTWLDVFQTEYAQAGGR